ncbi:methylthioribulose 1-phosphate dehydratase [Siccirubricoccus sp. KC 17139]|uniref:Methylthioribulose-1-phosphate dehydratase n=1 Tax=Siccirubricoccus soli TaxID=2899147 RepID=A0ABT1D832_9PROT|nr:methylthioribulose 1-phosphate dehydratase [Siccirubricoccus soli]MCO6417767.1 methylthioribulose 1-phosphate dehydratase [Siccirubricoccus soli]MCP2683902.1 methylthioribulose 1-phosphate dehydratase [Siccirubricoccus soli]
MLARARPGAVAESLTAATEAIIAAGRRMDRFGWVPATAGNISIRLSATGIAITRSGGHKGFLDSSGVILVDAEGRPLTPGDRASAETGLHCGIYRRFPEAGAVLHGHSPAATVLSRVSGDAIRLAGYELLKAFPGLPTHEAAIDLPVVANDQDIPRLQGVVEARWREAAGQPGGVVPGYVIRGHGVYVWAADMPGALTRLEALEFMLACELEQRRIAR